MKPKAPSQNLFPRFSFLLLATGAILFGAAGTLMWWKGWVLLAFTGLVAVLTANLFRRSPGLAEERRNAAAQAAPWDRILTPLLSGALPLLLIILAGLDKRLAWTHSLTALESLGAVPVMAGGMALTYGAMKSNPFFSSYVRIQKERGHTVVTGGPYRFLRHPGYSGAILYNLAAPVLLGSLAALGVGIAFGALTVLRTVLEDATLQKELKGYGEYARKVRYRLIPGIW